MLLIRCVQWRAAMDIKIPRRSREVATGKEIDLFSAGILLKYEYSYACEMGLIYQCSFGTCVTYGRCE